MAEYIEREAVLAKQYNASNFVNPLLAEMVVDVRDIEDIPAADVVEVVRCKDCRHQRERNKIEKKNYLFAGMLICTSLDATEPGWNPVFPDHFCSYGERLLDAIELMEVF